MNKKHFIQTHRLRLLLVALTFLWSSGAAAQTMEMASNVVSSGGGYSTGGTFTNYSVVGGEPVSSYILGGNYIAKVGFIYNSTEAKSDIPSDGLIAYYPFNGNANDQSGNENHPSSNYNLIETEDRFGNPSSAYSFDGVSSYTVGSCSNFPLGERTVSLWFKANTVSNRPVLFGYGGDPCGTSWFQALNHAGETSYTVTSHCGANSLNYAYPEEPLNLWTHWVITTSNSGTEMYVNGNLVLYDPLFISNTEVDGRHFSIGVGVGPDGLAPYTDGNLGFFDGSLDDIRIYNRALSHEEVLSLYHEGNWGLVTDIDGNLYSTVIIGDQEWLAKDLMVTHYNNGDPIPYLTDNLGWQNTTEGAYAIYPHVDIDGLNSDAEVLEAYSALYNWHAVTDARGLCPDGWHVPNDAELMEMVNYLGGLEVAGGKLKSTRTDPDDHPRWNSPNEGATNETGFSAFPAGYRNPDGTFVSFGTTGWWWPTDETSVEAGINIGVQASSGQVMRYTNEDKRYGISVRCIRDDAPEPTLYIYGDATHAGWDNTQAIEMERVGDGLFEITINIIDGQYIMFIGELGQSVPQWGTDNTGTSVSGPLVYQDDPEGLSPDSIPAPVPELYHIVVDINNLEYFINAVPKYQVTFNVDMTNATGFDPLIDDVYITGDMIGWPEPGTDPDNQLMQRVGETMIYTKTFELYEGQYQYKYFMNAGWTNGEWEGDPNRILDLNAILTVDDAWSSLYPDLFAGGAGGEMSPFLIETAEQLNNVRLHMGSHYLQVAVIDLGVSPWIDGVGWQPIGEEGNEFFGHYNGDGNTITGLTINRPEQNYVGLFGLASGSHITNLGLENVNVLGNWRTGALIGRLLDSGHIENVYSTGSVSGITHIGGLAGQVWASHVSNCYSHAEIFQLDYEYASQQAAGLIGRALYGSIVENSFSTGNVNGSENSYYNGGFIGVISEGSAITNCYSTGNVSGSGQMGGFAASIDAQSSIANCYSVGFVDGTYHAGGLVGFSWDETLNVTNSYWNYETSGQIESRAGEGKSTLEMISQASFNLWDFVDVWSIVEGTTYPYLQLQGVAGEFNNPIDLIPPSYLEATPGDGTINLSWQAPSVGTPSGYKIYRDSTLIATNADTELSYLDEGLENFTHYSYYVTATYDVEESNSTNSVTTFPNLGFGGGDGTEVTPYLISNADELYTVRLYPDLYFLQVADIDMTTSRWADGEGWLPIGDMGEDNFMGHYDGGDKIIDGLFINRPDGSYQGLFGIIFGATIKNVGLTNVNVTGSNQVGGLVARSLELSIIDSCFSIGNIYGNILVGGLVGAVNNSSITHSHSAGEVNGNDKIGGLTGMLTSYNESSSTISESYSTANVHSSFDAGGLSGSTSKGTILNSYATGNVSGDHNLGGLVGSIQSESIIENSYSVGSVNGNHDVGGLVGFDMDGSNTITNSYWNIETSGHEHSVGGEGRITDDMILPYDANTYVGWDFVGTWTDDATGVINNGYPILSSMVPNVFTLTITVNPAEDGAVEGAGQHAERTYVTVRAIPNPDYRFVNWTHEGVEVFDYSIYTFLMPSDDYSLTANFEPIPTSTVTDIDGNVYSTVEIGGRWWMSENLRVSKYRNGDLIADGTNLDHYGEEEDTPQYYFYYNDDPEHNAIYGKLYTWYVVNDSRGVCPDGWYVPTGEDWEMLKDHLDPYANEWENIAGGKMKTTGTLEDETGLWQQPNEGATNESGFSSVPGGYLRITKTSHNFYQMGQWAYYLSSTEFDYDRVSGAYNYYNNANLDTYIHQKVSGLTVRCIQNVTSEPLAPTVLTYDADEITPVSGVLHGDVTDNGGESVANRGFYWGTSVDITEADKKIFIGSGNGEFSAAIDNLIPNTTYYYRTYASNSAGVTLGDVKSFTTIAVDEMFAMETASTSFHNFWKTIKDYNIAMTAQVMADQTTVSWSNFGWYDNSAEPRTPWDNSPSYSNAHMTTSVWNGLYELINPVNFVIDAINNQGLIIGHEGADNPKVLATMYFIRGIILGHLGTTFDQAWIAKSIDDPGSNPLSPWNQVLEAAIVDLEQSIAISSVNTFLWNNNEVNGMNITDSYLNELANSYAARFLTSGARTLEQNNDLSWSTIYGWGDVLAFAQNGITQDFAPIGEGLSWEGSDWWDMHIKYLRQPGWGRVDMRIVNLLDPTQPVRYPTDNDGFPTVGTPPNAGMAVSNDARLDTDFQYLSDNNFRPDRGGWHFSHYRHSRYDNPPSTNSDGFLMGESQGPLRELRVWENQLILAEALIRANSNAIDAAAILNDISNPRKDRGGLTDVNAVEEDVLNAIFYERDIELFHNGYMLSFSDMRRRDMLQRGTPLHFPVPGSVLDALGQEGYTYGGYFNADGINTSLGGDWIKPYYHFAALTIEVNGVGGTTQPEEGGHIINKESEINLFADADFGYVFEKWVIGTDEIVVNPTSIIVTEDTTATAFFVETLDTQYELTLVINGGGSIYPMEKTYYLAEGMDFVLSATPEVGWKFTSWKNESDAIVSNDPDFTYTMPAQNVTLTANFNLLLTGETSKTWKLYRIGESMGVGPDLDLPYEWWFLENDGSRPCVYYHEFTFHSNGDYVFDDMGSFWGEEGIFPPELESSCFEAITENMVNTDGDDVSAWLSGTHTFDYDGTTGMVTLTGLGAWIGLPKLGTNESEMNVPQNSVSFYVTIEEYEGYDLMQVNFMYDTYVWQFNYASYSDPSLEPDVVGPISYEVTFNVDMTNAVGFDPAADVVYITGSMFGDPWTMPGDDPDNQTMERVGETMIWTKTMVLVEGHYEYKYFLNDGWANGEWHGEQPNRQLTLDNDMEVNDVWSSLYPHLYAGGAGNEWNPFLIETPEHLYNVRYNLGAYFLQIADIDLGVSPWNVGEGWEPITHEDLYFWGNYNGANHIVSNLVINRSAATYQGLFAGNLGKIANLGVENANVVDNGSRAGILAGTNWVWEEVPGVIDSCYTTGTIQTSSIDGRIGGLVGWNEGIISHSYSTAEVVSAGNLTGGLTGVNTGSGQIIRCYASGNVSGNANVGGLTGINQAGSSIVESFASGNVSGTDTRIGGLSGNCISSSTITNSYATGRVSGTEIVGGLVGITSEGIITNSYAVGYITADAQKGGLVGSSTADCVATYSYWDMETSSQHSSALGIGKTSQEMITQATFVDWDFVDVWSIIPDETYPYLLWQLEPGDHNYPEEVEYSLTVTTSVVPEGTGTVTIEPDNESYNIGDLVTLTAIPNDGYGFVNWINNGVVVSTDAIYEMVMPATNVTVTAVFTSLPKYTLSLSVNPEDAGEVIGAGEYFEGDEITVDATAHTGYYFLHWSADGVEVSDEISYTFPMPPNNYSLVANFEVEIDPISQTIPLAAGWNIFSSYLELDNPSMLTIVQPLINTNVLVKVQDQAGNSLEKVGEDWINDIGDINLSQGYKIRLTQNANLVLSGIYAEGDPGWYLNTGWNLGGYTLNLPGNALNSVQPIIDDGALQKVQSQRGAAVEKLQGIGWINRIGNFVPGQGYRVRVNADWASATADPILPPQYDDEVVFNPSWEGFGYDHHNIFILDAKLNEMELPLGTQIGVFDGDLCVGITVIGENQERVIRLIANQNDPYTSMADGFIPGNQIQLKVWDSVNKVFASDVEIEPLEGTGLEFLSGGTSIISLKATSITTGAHTLTHESRLGQIFPNPLTQSTTITFYIAKEQNVNLRVYNLFGHIVSSLINRNLDTGYHQVEWNPAIEKLPPGIYFIRMETPEFIQTKRVVFNR